jgi:putative peptidoglycan lipid II flippase
MKQHIMKQRIARNTFTVFSANILQAALGFSVAAFIAAVFGSAGEVDAFFIAAPLPILIGQFTLSVSLVGIMPHYQRLCERQGRDKALQEIAPLFWTWSLIALFIGALGFFATEPIARALAPGFEGERLTLLVKYLRWAMLATPFISAAGFLQALENADGHFFRPAFARPLITTFAFGALVTMFSDAGLEPFFVGLFVGALLTCLWQFLEVRSFGSLPLTIRGVSNTWRTVRSAALSMAFARGMGQGSELALQIIASLAAAGVVATYGFSFKIAAIPLMLSVSMALALFPAQSAAYAKDDPAESMRILWRGVNALTILGAFFGGFFYVWAEPLVILLYERGDFNPALTTEVAQTIRIFSLGLIVISANNAIANGFWAAQRMKERIIIEAIAIGILLLVAALTIQSLGPVGLAVAFVAQYIFLFFVGLWLLERNRDASRSHTDGYLLRLATFARVVVITGICVTLAAIFLPDSEIFRDFGYPARIGLIGLGGIGFSVVYFLGLYAFKVEEVRSLFQRFLSVLFHENRRLDAPDLRVETTQTSSKLESRQPAGKE